MQALVLAALSSRASDTDGGYQQRLLPTETRCRGRGCRGGPVTHDAKVAGEALAVNELALS